MTNISYITTVKEDIEGEPYIDLPLELLQKTMWDESTPLVYHLMEDGAIVVKKGSISKA